MNSLLTFRVALRALRKNKMRAGLTVLGVVIGITSVTVMVSIGQSASDLVQGQLESFGNNRIFVFPGSRRDTGANQGRGSSPTLTVADCDAVASECHGVLAVSPLVSTSGQVIYGNTNWSPQTMIGVGTSYLTAGNWQLFRGGFFTDRDLASAAKVCVVGRTVVKKLFQTTNPLGKTIRIKNIPFHIIGLLETKGPSFLFGDRDNIVLIPYTTVRKRLQGSSFTNVDYVLVAGRSAETIPKAVEEIKQLLCERHHVAPGIPSGFEVETVVEVANRLGTITGVMTLLLASIAGISLVVGGVGIMNIMLVSVTERTREIGIRLAVGARSRDILRQFLIEAIVLSSIGGIVGVLLGVGASTAMTTILNNVTPSTHWPVIISCKAAVIAMLFAGVVGVFFGFYPALRASRLDPIDALRYE